MTPRPDIILISLIRWDNPFSSTGISLAREFSRQGRVFVIDHPFSIKDILVHFNRREIRERMRPLVLGKGIFRQVEGFHDNLALVTPGITLPVNGLPPGKLFEKLRRFNDRRVWQAVRRILKEFQVRDFLLVNAFDPAYLLHTPSDLKPLLRIYLSVDEISHAPYMKRHGEILEKRQMEAADIVLATSSELQSRLGKISPGVALLPNAADTELFGTAANQDLPCPRELEGKPRPLILYTGNLDRSRVDFELLRKIAAVHPDKTLVLVGPVEEKVRTEEGLDRFPNILLVGSRPLKDLPAYLRQAGCAVIPFLKNGFTRGIYPLKINEYLAAGKPVVSTSFSADIRGFGAVAYLAEDHPDFLRQISIALDRDSPEKVAERIRVARSNSWSARVDQFWQLVDRSQAGRGHAAQLVLQ
ncbi:MAG TPA: glycosyltransferase [Chitinophagaceae bacterium]|nr:glycosyltransferase [Chitinophagaceae bacterium]